MSTIAKFLLKNVHKYERGADTKIVDAIVGLGIETIKNPIKMAVGVRFNQKNTLDRKSFGHFFLRPVRTNHEKIFKQRQ